MSVKRLPPVAGLGATGTTNSVGSGKQSDSTAHVGHGDAIARSDAELSIQGRATGEGSPNLPGIEPASSIQHHAASLSRE